MASRSLLGPFAPSGAVLGLQAYPAGSGENLPVPFYSLHVRSWVHIRADETVRVIPKAAVVAALGDLLVEVAPRRFGICVVNEPFRYLRNFNFISGAHYARDSFKSFHCPGEYVHCR